MAKLSSKPSERVKRGKAALGSRVLGVTADGVRILKPKKKSTHFTVEEIRETVASIRTAKSA